MKTVNEHKTLRLGAMTLGAVLLLLCAPASPGQNPRLDQMASRDHVNKGNYFLGRRQWQEAIAEYERAIELDPNNNAARANIPLVHNHWGASCFQQKRFDEALEHWETALKLDPYNRDAKHNIAVLKQTLARMGPQAGGKPPEAGGAPSGQPGAQAAKGKPAEPEIKILTPGIKMTSGSSSGKSEESAPAQESAPASQPPAEEESAPPPPPPPPASPPAPAPQGGGGSLEDQLSAIELKVYGRKQTDMTVLKRLEKIETDTAGQIRSGTIKDRIQFLKQSYGL